ncbi:uncharacterized protein LOC111615015 [Centruroides sculpturatus]|uniref:uncharacterized protein LOC111615015 n=1 Tax=Centruroides sculpturatus TaxID=218467 RepID=UPI000C6DF041|nr:uncharacterized protein LOC111615015 [Centruroides sculpturatus]
MYKLTISISASLCIIFFISKVAYGENCEKVINNCECVLKNNSVIDLTSTANNNGTPRYSFINIKDASTDNQTGPTEYFFFNPCFPFSLESVFPSSDKFKNCKNDFACIFHLSNDEKYQEEVISSNVKPTFTSLDLSYKEKEKSLTVFLHCDKTAEKAKVEEVLKNGNEYTLNLTTKCACAGGCHAPEPTPEPKSGSKLSTGSILLIVLFTFLVIYIIGGIIWNGYCLGASGIELLPNLEFWREFPALVTDGARFTVQCCMNRTTTYDSV